MPRTTTVALPVPLPDRVLASLTRRRGRPADDLMLRVTGAAALAAIGAVTLIPASAALMPFALFTIWANGPWSALLQGVYEPVILLYGRIYPPVIVGAVGAAATVFVEWINYHVYAAARDLPQARAIRDGRLTARITRLFNRSPFLAVLLCAGTILPYWVVRILSVLSRYSRTRHLVATGLGRFPKITFIAWLGAPLGIPARWLLLAAAAAFTAAVTTALIARFRLTRRAPRAALQHPITP